MSAPRAPSGDAYRAWFASMLPSARRMHRNGCDADWIAEELGIDLDDAAALVDACDDDDDEDDDADDVIGYAEPAEPEGDDGHGDYGYPDDWAFRANPRETY